MDGAECIARMDELQQSSLNRSDQHYFCESTENFTLEETGRLIGKVRGSAVGADAVLILLGRYHGPGGGGTPQWVPPLGTWRPVRVPPPTGHTA